ncbi:type IV pilus biogenesis protein PilM [Neobacillus jeddahensis]|uniref:type IV pilus biogenesis protein PilM n=1 Tax=Neobacillus jeddahensis TaxID=1461580 RepID=UPI0005916E2E|nr:pilus assembly protein PilM [Neobacillus jeddahensis]
MAFNLNFAKNRTVNITIKDHAIRYVELKNVQSSIIQRMGEYYLPVGLIKEGKILDFDTLSTILEQCVSEWKIPKRMVRFLVPDPFVVIRKVMIPKDIRVDEIKGYLYMEIGSSIHLPFEDPVFDFHLLDKGNSETNELLLFAAPETIVREYIDLFEEAKLKPVVADISSLALNRCFNQLDSVQAAENYIMIQCDLQTVNVCIFEKNIPVIMRHLTMDIDRGKWEHSLNSDSVLSFRYSGDREDILFPLEEIYNEIEKVMNFYQFSLNQGKAQVQKLLVDGDHPWLDEIYHHMRKRFAIPITKLSDLKESQDANQIPHQFYLNVGLGLKEV